MSLRDTTAARWLSPAAGRRKSQPDSGRGRRNTNSRRRYYAALHEHLDEISEYRAGDLDAISREALERQDIITRANHASPSTFYLLFGEDSTSSLLNRVKAETPRLHQALPYSGPVDSLIAETKVVAFWPYRTGWLAMLDEVRPAEPRTVAETLVRVLCEWAARHSELAALLRFAPPAAVVEDMTVVVESGADVSRLTQVLTAVVELAVDSTNVSPLGVLDIVRDELIAAAFPHAAMLDDPRTRPDLLMSATALVLDGLPPAQRRSFAPELRRQWATISKLLEEAADEHGDTDDLASLEARTPPSQPGVPPHARTADAWAPGSGNENAPDRGAPGSPPPASAAPRHEDVLSDEGSVRAAMQTLLHHVSCGGDPTEAEKIMAETHRRMARDGADRPVSIFVECCLEESRSRRRPVGESAVAWTGLLERAQRALGDADPTVMSIRTFQMRYAMAGGDPTTSHAAVQACHDAWIQRRDVLGADAYRTRMSRVNYAKALRDRDRAGDLESARKILREEVDAAARSILGPTHTFTLTVEAILAYTLIMIAERAHSSTRPAGAAEVAGPSRSDTSGGHGPGSGAEPAETTERSEAAEGSEAAEAADAETLTRRLVQARSERFGPTKAPTLRVRLLHAHALLLLGRHTQAHREINYVMAFAPYCRPALQPGWAEYLLARAEAVHDQARAYATACEALELRKEHFPEGSREIAEARRLVDELAPQRRAPS